MKKLILIVCFFGFLSNSFAQTNVYHPMPDSNAFWVEKYDVEISVSGGYNFYNTDSIKNTFMNGTKTYTSIFTDHPPFIYSVYPIGGYRNDSTGKVFFIWMDSIKEHILYEMNANIGDTIHDVACFAVFSSYSPSRIYDVIVTDTCHISIGTRLLKQVSFRYPDQPGLTHNWIEGIGNTDGPLNPHPTDMNTIHLACMSAYDTAWYPSYSLIPCNHIPFSISNYDNGNKLSISPNPFSTSTQISFDKTYQTLDLSIIDLQGKIIQQKSYHDCNNINLDRAGIANGFYFLRVSLDGKFVETKKVVVAD